MRPPFSSPAESRRGLCCAFTGLGAGSVDAIAGGGLIAVPMLLWAGLPPQVALGTNNKRPGGTRSRRGIRTPDCCVLALVERGSVDRIHAAPIGTRRDPARSGLLRVLIPPVLLTRDLVPGSTKTRFETRLAECAQFPFRGSLKRALALRWLLRPRLVLGDRCVLLLGPDLPAAMGRYESDESHE
jgi:hypothetical protein